MEIIRGTSGADALLAGTADTLIGGADNDTLDARGGDGGNWLFGQDGDDLLLAGSNDILVGGTGSDRLFAGSGGGVLAGGAGTDQLWLVNGELPNRVNVVTDYTRGEDILGLGGLTAEELFSLTLIQRDADTLVRIGGQNVAVLRNTDADSLTEDDFFVSEEVIFEPEIEVGFSFDPIVIPEGDRATLTLTLSESAPPDGLVLTFTIRDEVVEGGGGVDVRFVLEDSTNIIDAQLLLDNGMVAGVLIEVAEGATEASLAVEAIRDELLEGPEITEITLVPGPGYSVDPDNDTVSATIIDEPIVGDSLLAEILDRGFLRVGVLEGASGLSFLEEDGSFSGIGVDMTRAVAAALFDDPEAIEFVPQEFADSFANTANGIVDISAVAVQNLTREATLDIDYGPIYFYDGVGVLVNADSGAESVADLDGFAIAALEASTAIVSLEDAADDAGVAIAIETFATIDEMFAAYDAGEVDGVSIVRSLLAARIPSLSDPNNQLILDDLPSNDPLGMLIPEDESEWADVVNWATYATFQAEAFGITSENVDAFLDSDDPSIERFLGLEGSLGEDLGLENDFAIDIIEGVGNYGEIYANNFDEAILPRGVNEIWTEGGLLFSPPFA